MHRKQRSTEIRRCTSWSISGLVHNAFKTMECLTNQTNWNIWPCESTYQFDSIWCLGHAWLTRCSFRSWGIYCPSSQDDSGRMQFSQSRSFRPHHNPSGAGMGSEAQTQQQASDPLDVKIAWWWHVDTIRYVFDDIWSYLQSRLESPLIPKDLLHFTV